MIAKGLYCIDTGTDDDVFCIEQNRRLRITNIWEKNEKTLDRRPPLHYIRYKNNSVTFQTMK